MRRFRDIYRIVLLGIALSFYLEANGILAFGVAGRTEAHRAVPERFSPSPLPPGVLVIPVSGVLRESLHDDFGAPRVGHTHAAIDILAARGTPVLAASDGKVLKLFHGGAGGLTIYASDPTGRLIYYYAHLDGYAPGLTEGKPLSRGEVIGFVGTTGNAPPGTPHLHFAIERMPAGRQWWKGEPINPYPILRGNGVTVLR